jgi:hypothetical protein
MNKFAILALLSTAIVPAAFADIVTLDYTGNAFTSASDPFTTSDYITGEITYDASQVVYDPSNDGTVTSFVSWGFGIDGNNGLYTDQNLDFASSGNSLEIDLDPSGNVDGWNINLGRIIGELLTYDEPQFGMEDRVQLNEEGNPVASNSSDAGTWTIAAPDTPEPATALLLPLALGALYVLRRRLIV